MRDIPTTVNRGMVIDAGSGGSRLHIFHWTPRIFDKVPPVITFPTQDEMWTANIKPGVSSFVNKPNQLRDHLAGLLDFAIHNLADMKSEFHTMPLFFKGTGGLRELGLIDREAIMNTIRALLSDKTFCPFHFHPDFARVISGEEEAIFSWAAVNFLMNTLFPVSTSQEMRILKTPGSNFTYGTVDLGGASTQIAFFLPTQDISEGLFKLQIGAEYHWNVYTKSFLEFGLVSARRRHVTSIADEMISSVKPGSAEVPSAIDYCFFSGYSEYVPGSASDRNLVMISGPPVPAGDQFYLCAEAVKPLFRKYDNAYCDVVYDNQCSINGAYQPTITPDMHFIGTSKYAVPWALLRLPQTTTLEEYRKRAVDICSMSFSEVIFYFEVNNLILEDEKLGDYTADFCFLTAYIYVLLVDGYGFAHNQTMTVMNEVNGNKVGWAFGAILYEINVLPWMMAEQPEKLVWAEYFLCVVAGGVIGALITMFVARDKFFRKKESPGEGTSLGEEVGFGAYGSDKDDSGDYAGPAVEGGIAWRIRQLVPFSGLSSSPKKYSYMPIEEGSREPGKDSDRARGGDGRDDSGNSNSNSNSKPGAVEMTTPAGDRI
jgi:hypothetical protein